MNRQKLIIPDSPSVLKAVREGFDAVTNHLTLLLFPVGLDLLLWFGPHVRVKRQIEALIREMNNFSAANSPEMADMIAAGKEIWLTAAERINLVAALRSYPIGVFSLLSSMFPVRHPLGRPSFVEISGPGEILGLLILFSLGGLVLGTLYFSAVKSAALEDRVRWISLFQKWPRQGAQAFVLGLICLAVFLAVLVFGTCLVTGLALIDPAFARIGLLGMGILFTWLFFPLFFSPHGIFTRRLNAWQSVVESMKLANLTFIKTGFFILLVVLITQGLDVLWQTPPEDSWLMLVSILGHSFITTGVLAASFVYYQKMVFWVREIQALRELDFRPEEKF
jgi:hypothetical protein